MSGTRTSSARAESPRSPDPNVHNRCQTLFDFAKLLSMKRLFVLVSLALGLSLSGGRAGVADDQYVRIYNLIQDADALNSSSSQAGPALAKYLEAQTALQNFHKFNPDWNPKVVEFRLSYLAGKIADLAAKAPLTGTNVSAMPKPGTGLNATFGVAPKTIASTNLDAQASMLRDQVRQLQADKLVLEAKLKEALAALPAALDPRELAKAEEKITSLQKENDLLKLTLGQEKSRPGSGADTKSLLEAQQALTDANRKLAEQTERANTLALERDALQNKVKSLMAAPGAAEGSALEATRKELAEANRELVEQKALASRLASEKAALQAQLKDSAGAAVLRAENEVLKKELATLRAAPPAVTRPGEASPQVTKSQAELAKLQSDKEILRLEKMALENRVKQLMASGPPSGSISTSSGTVVSSTVLPPLNRPEDVVQVRQLEQERDELQKKLLAANKELYGRNGKVAGARIEELESQMMILRARLEVFEARQVPYTSEELALFKASPPKLSDPKAGKKSVRELPAGAAPLVAEARRYFAAKQYDKAEERYQQVLKQDEQNAPVLADLAAIQFERNELAEAERNINQAVALAPEDPYCSLILGMVKFRQEKYDDALDALSRAAKLDPQNAEVQNYLGITLSNKGMRGPAETALRKAIQLQPGYGAAHQNLAVVYVTQQPPMTELARWHYQKALAGGQPHNADLEKILDAPKTAETK
jgi:tetratricopeptide (TPR) repeat protein